MTGVETGFDVVDEPLKRPDRPAGRHRAVPRGRAHPAARREHGARRGRRSQGAGRLQPRQLFPDFGLGARRQLHYDTPSADLQNNACANGDNYLQPLLLVRALGFNWNLDLLPQAARTQQAESQLEETRALERLALGNAEFEVEKAYADAVEAKAREETWDKAEHISKQWIPITQDHIDLGTWDETKLLEPLRAYGNARVQHLQALMDFERDDEQPRHGQRLGQRGA